MRGPITFICIGLVLILASVSPAFVGSQTEEVQYLGTVGDGADMYRFKDGQNTCYMLVGQLHGKTVSISCVRGT